MPFDDKLTRHVAKRLRYDVGRLSGRSQGRILLTPFRPTLRTARPAEIVALMARVTAIGTPPSAAQNVQRRAMLRRVWIGGCTDAVMSRPLRHQQCGAKKLAFFFQLAGDINQEFANALGATTSGELSEEAI
jgi:hypothetical protein